MKKYKTDAQRAEEELSHYFGHENRVYKPWQLIEHLIEPVQIEGTVDDVLLLANANVYVRPQFAITEEQVDIPNLFCKLNGDVEGFLLDMKALRAEHDGIVEVYSTFSKMARPANKTPLLKQPGWFDKSRGIDVDAALMAHIPNIQILRPVYQRNYLRAINRVLERVKSDKYCGQRPTEREILEVLLYNSNKIIRMFHHFDYQYVNPKFVVHDEKGVTVTTFAVIRLLMMQALGFDVFVVSESGYASIENYLTEDVCKTYQVTSKERMHSPALKNRQSSRRKLIAAALSVVGIALMYGLVRVLFGL